MSNSIYNLFKTTVSSIFKPYISNKIPESQTNVFWQLFSGIDHSFTHLEMLLRSHKRERNVLTAQHIASLRTHAAANGFEPVLKIPSTGLVQLELKQEVFSKNGFPLYLPPYAVFNNSLTGVSYYYNSNKTLKIDSLKTIIPLVEGELSTMTHQSLGDELERIYIESNSVAQGSITVTVNNVTYTEVKSFLDHQNNQNTFVVKFSERQGAPIVLYVRGTKQDDTVNIVFRSTFGESGNINYDTTFTTNSMLDLNGKQITLSEKESSIVKVSGFTFGSNGTDKNTLQAAIGFNHGVNLLFDTVSYTNFISRYSTLILQGIKLENPLRKSINTIYVGRKNNLTKEDNIIITQYKECIDFKQYLLSTSELENLSTIIEENEFALSSHILKHLNVTKYALQIVFNTKQDIEDYSEKLNNEVYKAFSVFLQDKSYVLNLELLFNNFMNDNNVIFEYDLFNSDVEQAKIVSNTTTVIETTTDNNTTKVNNELVTSYIIKHENSLPILKGDFMLKTDTDPVELFFDINTVVKYNK